jgi:hypothetical protein
LLIVAGAAAIAQTGISPGQQALALTVFVVIASIGVGRPVVIYFRCQTRHPCAPDWISAASASIFTLSLGLTRFC